MRFIFITREGYLQPGARMRSYGLSDELKKRGLDSEVLSFTDHLGAKAGRDETDFTIWEKLVYAGRGIGHLARRERPVFIINRFNYHTLPGLLVSMIKKSPFVFDMDDWEAREDTGYYLGIFPKSKAETLTRFTAKRSKLCIAASRYLKDYLSRFNKNVYYIPTGIDLDKFKLRGSKKRGHLIFSWHGSVNRREVVDYIAFIIDCFDSLRKKYDFIKLTIAGDGIFGRELKKMVEEKNAPDVEYEGWLHPDAVPSYVEDADIGLVPLLEQSRFNLSKSPVKLLEYMAVGRPVIASKTGEARYIVNNGINGFLAADKDEFVYYMEELIKDPSRIKELGINAHQTVRKSYSLDKMGERLYSLILDNFA
ncbi:MAG: glycosyltransferase [Candidatus Omnitrophica bacterium]|nr:glycosyltransferase [Candidatus Omnitrophota bacterium]